jgi:hypothetical protein
LKVKKLASFAVLICFSLGAQARTGWNVAPEDSVRFSHFFAVNASASHASKFMPNNIVPILASVTNPDYTRPNNVVSNMTQVGMVNPNGAKGGDYRLCHGVGNPSPLCTAASQWVNTATDGKDPGADWNAVMAAIAGVE